MRKISKIQTISSALWNSQSLSDALSVDMPFDISSNRISIDSRNIQQSDIFIGIKGENHDGNEFAKDALANGAALAIVDKKNIDDPRIIVVEDSYEALLTLAKYNRKRSGATFVGITGSNGKTTTKELLSVALQDLCEVYSTRGNYNNHIGMPLCLANLPLATEVAVLEMGMSNAGEIEFLSKLAKPHISIITTISDVHKQNFSSTAGIAAAKSEIFAGMRQDDFAIVNVDHPYRNILTTSAADQKLNIITFGKADDAVIKLLDVTHDLKTFSSKARIQAGRNWYDVTLHTLSEKTLENLLAVIGTLTILKIDIDFAIKNLLKFQNVAGRGKFEKIKDKLLIDESYNASPASMKAAIGVLGHFKKNRKVAILSDMRELGKDEISEHRDLKDALINHKIDRVVTIGPLSKHLNEALGASRAVMHFESVEDVTEDDITKILNLGDVLLFKGSNGTKLHQLYKYFIAFLQGI